MYASSSKHEWQDPSDEEILAASRCIIFSEPCPALGDHVERLDVVAQREDIGNQTLRHLYDYWEGKKSHAVESVVVKDDIDVVDLRKALGNLMLLDVERDGLDAVYRVYGTGIADQAGRDWTGYRVSEMNRRTKTPLALLYRACYRAVFETKSPLYSCHKSPPWLAAKAWERLILPLCDPAGHCIQFLVGNIPLQPQYLSYEDRQKIRRAHRD